MRRSLLGTLTACAVIASAVGLARADSDSPPPRSVIENAFRPVGERNGVPVYRKELLLNVFTVDQIYRSMRGPLDTHQFVSLRGAPPERLWVTGFEAVMVEPDGTTPMSQEFMCHSNLQLLGDDHYQRFRTQIPPSGGRLFSLAQGQLSIQLPDGFGVPIMSDQQVRVGAQVLNHNVVDETVEVRHRISLDFVRERDLPGPLKPLHPRAVFGTKLIEGPNGYLQVPLDEVDPAKHGEGCQIGEDAGGNVGHGFADNQGRRFTGFWRLPPGREENHTLVTRLLALPFDTTLHYVAVHLHPFAESVELRDLTSGKTVYKSKTRQADQGIGLAEVEYFSSEEGLPLYKDHEYELISIYNNTSGTEQDAMATMFLYIHLTDLTEVAARP